MPIALSTNNHNRDSAGLKYVYPVMSRRAGGLSIGINFNPNNACNWRCIYCQVPNLQRGTAPEIDFDLLKNELVFFLDQVLNGNFFSQFKIPVEQRIVKDIAISGNGEPTSLKNFDQAIRLIGETACKAGIFPGSCFVLISNGSLIHQQPVQSGLEQLARFNGELWFKLDSATPAGRQLINNTSQNQTKLIDNLEIASRLCPTKLQTCMLRFNDHIWSSNEKQAYLRLLQELKSRQINLQKIMLYSLARPSFQPEADALESISFEEMTAFAADIKALGYDVSVS